MITDKQIMHADGGRIIMRADQGAPLGSLAVNAERLYCCFALGLWFGHSDALSHLHC